MTKEKSARLSDVIGLLNRISPPDLAEDWDNVGLQVGDPDAVVERILVCLDAEKTAFDVARRLDVQLIITHHPLIFRPLKRLSRVDATGALLWRAVEQKVAVVAAHTNLDRANDGLNDWLARRLGLLQVKPLERPKTDSYRKLVVYVPQGHEAAVMEAVFAAGAGQIGAYDRCSFRTSGTGTFRGGEGTDPFIGTSGVFEEAQELRLETIFPVALQERVLARMIKAHHYEAVAYDLIPLENPRGDVGLGRIGKLEQPISLTELARQVKQKLELSALRIVGEGNRMVSKVAVCGGSGMVTYADAVRGGADCLITGDVKFHEAQQAHQTGVAVIDAGHFGTEKIMIAELARRLRTLATEHHYTLEVFENTEEHDPFMTIT